MDKKKIGAGFAGALQKAADATKAAKLVVQDMAADATFEIFRRHGTEPSHFSKIMDICYATKFEAQKLEVRERQALILQKDMAFDQNGDAIHYTKLVINPERYKLTIIM